VAGTISTTATYPLDLLRTRFAAQGPQKIYPSLLGGIKQIHTNEGTKGFFRGLAAANVQIVPYMGLFFTCYEVRRYFCIQKLEFACSPKFRRSNPSSTTRPFR
jgi:hypothetical protein